MTPLAQKIMRDSCQLKPKRQFLDRCELVARLANAHCFDVSEVFQAADVLGQELGDKTWVDGKYFGLPTRDLAFLPAPLTWIEWRTKAEHGVSDGRMGCLLHDLGFNLDEHMKRFKQRDSFCAVDWVVDNSSAFASSNPSSRNNAVRPDKRDIYCGILQLSAGMVSRELRLATAGPTEEFSPTFTVRILTWLAMINSPRIIGRRQHMPHAGLQRDLARSKGLVGKFPLRAWTEIRLEVGPPKIDEDDPHEARLTGEKALHFCRAHLRVRNGQLEHVRAHWRGNPALGMKQSRYRVVAPA